MRLRLGEATPVVAYDNFDEYVTLVVETRDRYHNLMVEELSTCRWKHRQQTPYTTHLVPNTLRVGSVCTWNRLRHEGAVMLLFAAKDTPNALGWSLDANDAIVISLQAAMFAYICNVVRPSHAELVNVLHSHIDTLLGYPDCCWGWQGPGVLRDLVRSSFMAMISPPHVSLISKSKWPLHEEAVAMARHERLGKDALLGSLDSDVLCYILHLAKNPGPPLRVTLS